MEEVKKALYHKFEDNGEFVMECECPVLVVFVNNSNLTWFNPRFQTTTFFVLGMVYTDAVSLTRNGLSVKCG